MHSTPPPPAPPPPPFHLSALLHAHTSDVRSLVSCSSSSSASVRLLSGSRDCTARLWQTTREEGGGGYEQRGVWRDPEEGWVNCVGWVPPRSRNRDAEEGEDEGEEEGEGGYLISAGADALIHLFPLPPPSSSPDLPSSTDTSDPPIPTHTLAGHSHNVCAVNAAKDGRRIASASWDLTARVWEFREEGEKGEWECERVLVGHGGAVWDVLLLEKNDRLVLTACADSRIRLFDGADLKLEMRGHEGPVRALAKLVPDDVDCALFASASNDGSIRVWNYQTGDALTVLGRHDDSFVYALATLSLSPFSSPSSSGAVSSSSTGGLASSGEDGIIKIWNESTGEEDQQILVPALSVWSLAALVNGDLACGCSDNLIWVFSRDEGRRADQATREVYEKGLEEMRAKRETRGRSAGSARLPVAEEGREALETLGGKEGEVKLVKEGEKVTAFQWSGMEWAELGEVVDSPDDSTSPSSAHALPSRAEHDGQLYDYVFSIDVKDDEPPLKLPFNLDDDPHAVATDFVEQHKLPESYVEQIVAFIRSSSS